MKTVQHTLNQELEQGKSIAWWACGYYVTASNVHCPALKIVIFGWEQNDKHCKVLVDYLGSMMWINIWTIQLHVGWGGENPPSPEGKTLRLGLEQLMN